MCTRFTLCKFRRNSPSYWTSHIFNTHKKPFAFRSPFSVYGMTYVILVSGSVTSLYNTVWPSKRKRFVHCAKLYGWIYCATHTHLFNSFVRTCVRSFQVKWKICAHSNQNYGNFVSNCTTLQHFMADLNQTHLSEVAVKSTFFDSLNICVDVIFILFFFLNKIYDRWALFFVFNFCW